MRKWLWRNKVFCWGISIHWSATVTRRNGLQFLHDGYGMWKNVKIFNIFITTEHFLSVPWKSCKFPKLTILLEQRYGNSGLIISYFFYISRTSVRWAVFYKPVCCRKSAVCNAFLCGLPEILDSKLVIANQVNWTKKNLWQSSYFVFGISYN